MVVFLSPITAGERLRDQRFLRCGVPATGCCGTGSPGVAGRGLIGCLFGGALVHVTTIKMLFLIHGHFLEYITSLNVV